MTARKLIEEAEVETQTLLSGIYQAQTRKDLTAIREKLSHALSLLPEWQEFDASREETWPKPKEMPEWFLVCRSDCGVSWDTWGNEGWESDENGLTLAWMPLPSPYIKP